MVFLQSHGLGTLRAVRIFKTYGSNAIPLIKETLIASHATSGIGFVTADQIAQKTRDPEDLHDAPTPASPTPCCKRSRVGIAGCQRPRC